LDQDNGYVVFLFFFAMDNLFILIILFIKGCCLTPFIIDDCKNV